MTLTLASLKTHAKHALGGASADDMDLDLTDIVNDAGKTLYNCHNWNWKHRPPLVVGTVASQTYVELPPDFGQAISMEVTGTVLGTVHWTTIRQILAYRAKSVGTHSSHWVAIAHPSKMAPNVAPPGPRLEIWPTPSADDDDALTLTYLADWVDLVDETDTAAVPVWLYPMLKLFVRETAKGWEEDIDSVITQRWDAILSSRAWDRALARDGGEQPDFGPHTGGLLQTQESFYDFRTQASAAEPS